VGGLSKQVVENIYKKNKKTVGGGGRDYIVDVVRGKNTKGRIDPGKRSPFSPLKGTSAGLSWVPIRKLLKKAAQQGEVLDTGWIEGWEKWGQDQGG